MILPHLLNYRFNFFYLYVFFIFWAWVRPSRPIHQKPEFSPSETYVTVSVYRGTHRNPRRGGTSSLLLRLTTVFVKMQKLCPGILIAFSWFPIPHSLGQRRDSLPIGILLTLLSNDILQISRDFLGTLPIMRWAYAQSELLTTQEQNWLVVLGGKGIAETFGLIPPVAFLYKTLRMREQTSLSFDTLTIWMCMGCWQDS